MPRRDSHPASLLHTHATPLPAPLHSPRTIASHRVPECSRLSRGTGWACRRGRSVLSAACSQMSGRPRSQAGKGRTGRSPGPGRRAVSLGCLPLRTHPVFRSYPLLPGLTRVLTHTELGTQLCCPVSHSLMSVQTWMAGSAEVTAHTHKTLRPPFQFMSPLHPTSPLYSSPNLNHPDEDPSPISPPGPGPPPLPAEARQENGRKTVGPVY